MALYQSLRGLYLIHDILKRVWAIDCKAHKQKVRLGVREWPQTVVLLLSRSIPQSQLDRLS